MVVTAAPAISSILLGTPVGHDGADTAAFPQPTLVNGHVRVASFRRHDESIQVYGDGIVPGGAYQSSIVGLLCLLVVVVVKERRRNPLSG